MTFEKRATLGGGEEVLLRSLEARDAAAAIWLMRKAAEETHFLMREAEECGATIAQETEFIERMRCSKREILLGAFLAGELVGMANIAQVGPRFRVRHRAQLGISLVQAHWGKGVGTAMMRALIACARDAGYEQIELEVVHQNERALALYRRFGFETVGRMPHAMKYADGSYADFVTMRLVLDET